MSSQYANELEAFKCLSPASRAGRRLWTRRGRGAATKYKQVEEKTATLWEGRVCDTQRGDGWGLVPLRSRWQRCYRVINVHRLFYCFIVLLIFIHHVHHWQDVFLCFADYKLLELTANHYVLCPGQDIILYCKFIKETLQYRWCTIQGVIPPPAQSAHSSGLTDSGGPRGLQRRAAKPLPLLSF